MGDVVIFFRSKEGIFFAFVVAYTVSFSSVKIFIFAVIPFDASHPFSHFEFKDRNSFF